jgi:hypothetical protein
MPALVVTRAETRWNVTFANPPANLVDPETVLFFRSATRRAAR